MAGSLETLQACLQQAQAEYVRMLQEIWDAWLKHYEQLSQQQLRVYQDMLTQLQDAPRYCATPAGGCDASAGNE
ncbi:MAG TPA: hypothetical protein VF469_25085 [Kofleriaceae bacterium]